MQMTDILPVEGWLALEQEIFERFGLNARVYDDKGVAFTGATTWCNRLCPALRTRPGAVSAICSVAHQAMAAEAKASGAPVIGECDAGLLKICVPVFADGQLIGEVDGCGRLLDDGEVDSFMVEKSAGMSEDEVAQLARGIRPMTTAEAEAFAGELRRRIEAAVAAAKAKRS